MTLNNNPNVELKVKKTDEICSYVNKFSKLMKNKYLMKYGE